jgi:hypothetical protein
MTWTQVFLIFAVLASAPCTKACEPSVSGIWSEKHNLANEATLTASFQATQSSLIVVAVLTNVSAAPIFLTDIRVRVGRNGTTVETGHYKIELTKDRDLQLLSRLSPVDPRIDYAVPPSAYASMLPPGGQKEIKSTLEFPLIPGNLPPTKDVVEIACDRVTLIYGLIPSQTVPNAIEQVVAGVKIWRLPLDAWQKQKELRVEARVSGVRILVNR